MLVPTMRPILAAALVFSPLWISACSSDDEVHQVYPRTDDEDEEEELRPEPTENPLEEEAEEEQNERRKEWFEHRHQAGPDVDWRALERANGDAQIEKRNQLHREALATASPWVERGSQNQAGRVHVAVPAPDGAHLYVGTALGGMWRGTLAGADWTPLGDNLYGGVHHMAVLPGATAGAPDVLLAATSSGSVRVSTDDGGTWLVPGGLAGANSVKRVLRASDGSEAVFVLRRFGSNWRLMRSTDRMATFQSVLDLGTFGGDAWIRRDGSADLYALTASGVRRSTNLGDSWTSMGPAPAAGSRGELAGSEAGAPRLWAVVNEGTLQRSDDAGASWTPVTTVSDYWSQLEASIVDPDVLLWGGVETHRTANGGGSFSVINTWGEYYGNPAGRLHADIDGIDVVADPGSPFGEDWYIATDGGLYRSEDVLGSVHNLSLSGLRISQYYTTHTSSAAPEHVVAGSQDQGYQRASALPPATESNLAFAQLISGDYGHLTSGDGDHDFLFCTYPGFVLLQKGESLPQLFTEDFPAGEDHAWMPPVVADPLEPSEFFLCASHLYRYDKVAASNWTPSLWSTYDFGVAAGEYVSALAFSPVDSQRAYAVTDRGRLFHSSDHGVSWTPSTSTGPSGQYFYGTALLASSTDVDTVWVGGSGYSGPAVYQSKDGGVSFAPDSTGLPPTLVYCLGEAPDGSGAIFCGTETAAYRRDPGTGSWVDLTGAQAPVTVYWSVEALPNENTLRFGTYGRGIWDYQIDLQARVRVRNGSGVNPLCLSASSAPELGGLFGASISSAPFPVATQSTLVLRESPAAGPIFPFGEVLIGGAKLVSFSRPITGGASSYLLPVPNDSALVGITLFGQGVLFGGGFLLCNGLELVLGF